MTLDAAGLHTCSHGPIGSLSDRREQDICLIEIMMLDVPPTSEMGKLSLPGPQRKSVLDLSVLE